MQIDFCATHGVTCLAIQRPRGGVVHSLDEIRLRYGLGSPSEIAEALEEGETLPVEFYFAPEVHALEQEKIFSKSWQYACHISLLENAGDYAVARSGDIPVVVTRGRDGELHGFVNICRHRLHSVVEGNGSATNLQCPYHGWVYDLEGRLKSAPRSKRERSFDCAGISLAPVAVEAWDQWVFVNPDPTATSLEQLTSEFRVRTDDLNRDLSEYNFQVRYEYTMECNWKIWAENAIECYHCPILHRNSYGRAYATDPERYHVYSTEDNIWHDAPIRWLPTGEQPAGLKGFRFAFTFPSSFFALDDYVGFVGSVQPLAPERCFAYVDMYSRPGADETVVKEWLKMWDQTLIEDKRATDIQQLGYRSRAVPTGRLMLDSESPLQAFMSRTLAALSS